MRFYFNGCSHTYGDDLEEPEKVAWPVLVANHYNVEFLNDAMSGGTNDRIVQRTLKYINDYDKFYIAWTSISRFSHHCSDANSIVNFNANLVNAFYSGHERFDTYGTLYYKYWFDEIYAFKNWLHQIILLQAVFEKNNKNYTMLISDKPEFIMLRDLSDKQNLLSYKLYDMNDDQIEDEYNEIETLLSQINFDKFVDWKNWYLRKFRNDVKLGKTRHYLEEGHQKVADYILARE